MSEIAEKVRDEREDLALKKVYYQEMQENEELIKMKFLGELISGKLSLADAMEKGKRFHMNLSGPFLQDYFVQIYPGGSCAGRAV